MHDEFTLRGQVFYNSSQRISPSGDTHTQFGYMFIKGQMVINK